MQQLPGTEIHLVGVERFELPTHGPKATGHRPQSFGFFPTHVDRSTDTLTHSEAFAPQRAFARCCYTGVAAEPLPGLRAAEADA